MNHSNGARFQVIWTSLGKAKTSQQDFILLSWWCIAKIALDPLLSDAPFVM